MKVLRYLWEFIKKISLFLFKYKYIIFSGLLGAFIFLEIYGMEVLDVKNIDWLVYARGDLNQHYLGWEYFRRSPWNIIIGLNTICNYPFASSVIFTDSIPWVATLFKIFSNILPEYFQYFGIYGMFCFIMQGVMASIVLKKFIKNDYATIVASVFFIISPIMIYRMYYHTALASHYLILLAISLIIYKDKLDLKKSIVLWGLVGFLSASTHIYFLVINGIILIGYLLYELLTKRSFKKLIFTSVSYLIISFFTIFIFGGFSMSKSVFGDEGFGYINFNLNGFYNPMHSDYSQVLEVLPYRYIDEGFSYLGFGILLSLGLSVIALIFNIIYKLIRKKEIKLDYKLFLSFILIGIISLLFSSLKEVYYGEELLFNVELPKILSKVLGVFRSNGRFIWGLYYFLMLGGIAVFYKNSVKFIRFIILCLLLYVQIYDLKVSFENKQIKDYSHIETISSDWDKLFREEFDHVIFSSEFFGNDDVIAQLHLLALKYNKTINYFYLAQDRLKDMTTDYFRKIVEKPCDGCLYIIDPGAYIKCNNMDLNYYMIDKFYIATDKELNYLEKIIPSEDLDIITNKSLHLRLYEDKKYNLVITSEEQLTLDDIEVQSYSYEIIDNKIDIIIENQQEGFIHNRHEKSVNIKLSEVE